MSSSDPYQTKQPDECGPAEGGRDSGVPHFLTRKKLNAAAERHKAAQTQVEDQICSSLHASFQLSRNTRITSLNEDLALEEPLIQQDFIIWAISQNKTKTTNFSSANLTTVAFRYFVGCFPHI